MKYIVRDTNLNFLAASLSLHQLYNYADDNTLSFHTPDFNELIKILQQEGKIFI